MRKNVLILCHSDGPQFIDVCNQYTALFDKAKYEVTVAYLVNAPSEESISRTTAEKIEFLDIPRKDIKGLKIKAIKKLLSFCRQKKFEIVICQRYKPSYIMMWVALFCKIPAMIFIMHELGTMAARGRQWLIKLLYRSNMLFAGVSNAVRNDMRADLWSVPKEKIITLYNMADIDWTEPQLLSRQAAREALKLPPDTFVFGCIAYLVPNKDHQTLIQAFANAKKSCPNAKLILLGSGKLEQELKDLVATLDLQKDIIFAGFVVRAFSYAKAFDCFTLASTQEAFGRVFLEAMIAKTPIIASNTQGIPEVVGDSGILVTPKDIDGFAAAMEKMYTMPLNERQAMAEKGYQRVCQNFSTTKFFHDFWQLPLLNRLQ